MSPLSSFSFLPFNDGIYHRNRKLIRDLLLYVLLVFPISSLLKTKLSGLNLLLTGITVLLFFIYYFFNRFHFRQFAIALYIAGTLLLNIVRWGFHYYENNMLFYFPFLLLYFEFIKLEKDEVLNFFKKHHKYIDVILLIWNLAVFISLFLGSSYVYEGETKGFVSFAGTTFLLCPIAINIFAITLVQYQIHHRNIYICSFIVSSLCILMGSSRTYLAVLLCAWLLFIYIRINNKRIFPCVVILGLCAFLLLVLVSPISEKFLNATSRTSTGMDPLEAFTSGRSVFWSYDVQQIFKSSPLELLLGHGVNWLFYLNYALFGNPLWAHNDFIQILSDYGLLGLCIYIWAFVSLSRELLKNCHVSALAVFFLIFMWFFNAFFNMFYTYFCASLSLPLFFLAIHRETAQARSHQAERSLSGSQLAD